jgi:hypothetical protein
MPNHRPHDQFQRIYLCSNVQRPLNDTPHLGSDQFNISLSSWFVIFARMTLNQPETYTPTILSNQHHVVEANMHSTGDRERERREVKRRIIISFRIKRRSHRAPLLNPNRGAESSSWLPLRSKPASHLWPSIIRTSDHQANQALDRSIDQSLRTAKSNP